MPSMYSWGPYSFKDKPTGNWRLAPTPRLKREGLFTQIVSSIELVLEIELERVYLTTQSGLNYTFWRKATPEDLAQLENKIEIKLL